MKIKLSRELVWKFKTLQGKISIESIVEPKTYLDNNFNYHAVPGNQYVDVIVDLSDHSYPYDDIIACEKWMNTHNTYFSTSYKACRVDIGSFKGLYPVEIDVSKTIIGFRAEEFDHNPNWKDWFVVEGESDAPFIFIELLSHVRNS